MDVHFIEIVEYCKKISRDTSFLYKSIADEFVHRTVRKEYSSANDSLNLGYYDPSLVMDIITGNVKRPKLYKRSPSIGSEVFEYGFDSDDKILYVKHGKYCGDKCISTDDISVTWTYFFFYDDDITILGYDGSHRRETDMFYVAKCIYEDNRTSEYWTSLLYLNDNAVDICNEKYIYNDCGLLDKAIVTNITGILPDEIVTNKQEIKFMHDENGYVVRYMDEFGCLYDVPKNKQRIIGLKEN